MRALSVLSRDRSKHSEKGKIGSVCYWRSADRAAACVQPRRMPCLPHHMFKVGLSIAKFFNSISLSFATILERPSTPVEDLCERSALQLRARVQLVSKNNRAEFELVGARLPCLLTSPATPHQGGLLYSMISAFDRPGNCSEPGLQLPASTSSSDFKISTSPRHPESKNHVSMKALRKPSTLSLSDQTPPISLGTAAAALHVRRSSFRFLILSHNVLPRYGEI